MFSVDWFSAYIMQSLLIYVSYQWYFLIYTKDEANIRDFFHYISFIILIRIQNLIIKLFINLNL